MEPHPFDGGYVYENLWQKIGCQHLFLRDEWVGQFKTRSRNIKEHYKSKWNDCNNYDEWFDIIDVNPFPKMNEFIFEL